MSALTDPKQVCKDQEDNENSVTRDKVVMQSGGTIPETAPNYKEEDDVMDSIAEGYF